MLSLPPPEACQPAWSLDDHAPCDGSAVRVAACIASRWPWMSTVYRRPGPRSGDSEEDRGQGAHDGVGVAYGALRIGRRGDRRCARFPMWRDEGLAHEGQGARLEFGLSAGIEEGRAGRVRAGQPVEASDSATNRPPAGRPRARIPGNQLATSTRK